MSEERIVDKFLRKLYEKTVNNGTQNIDGEEIGKEIGVIDVQIDNLVDELTAEGYVKKLGRTKDGTYLPKDGDRVHVWGAWVTDKPKGWHEIHPTWKVVNQ